MPAKKKNKQQKNAFYWFMQELMPQLRREGRVFPNGMQDVVGIALPRWKSLPEEEKERFERIAKEEKKKSKNGPTNDAARLDNQGNVIACRKDSRAEYLKRIARESKIARSRWPKGKDILDMQFYLISFQYLCKTEEDIYLPLEVGMVEFSLKQGIINTLNQFIDPGEETHQIPIEKFSQASNNYRGLWIKMENFVNPNLEKSEFPPIYCLGSDMECTESCMDWLQQHACLGYVNRLNRVYILENLLVNLYDHIDKQISETGAIDILTGSTFDYEANSRCQYHEELEVKHCGLGVCKRQCYAIFDSLASEDAYDFPLTPNHLPCHTDSKSAYTVIPPSAVHMDPTPRHTGSRGAGPSGGRRGYQGSYNRSSGTSSAPYASQDIRYQQTASAPVTEELHDDDIYDDDDDDVSITTGLSFSGPPARGGYNAPAAPRAGRGRSQLTTDPGALVSEWPAVGGTPVNVNGAKFAGRTGPPPPSQLPHPKGWAEDEEEEEDEESPVLRQPKTMPMVMSQQMRGGGQPSLGQPRQPVPPAMTAQSGAAPRGRGTPPSWRPAGMAFSNAAPQRPTLHQVVRQQEQAEVWKPTLHEAVRQPIADETKCLTLHEAVKQRNLSSGDGGRPTLRDAVRQKETSQAPTPAAGRGRGIMMTGGQSNPWSSGSPWSQAQYTGPPSPQRTAGLQQGPTVRPPRGRGFGRGRGYLGHTNPATGEIHRSSPGSHTGASVEDQMHYLSMDDVE